MKHVIIPLCIMAVVYTVAPLRAGAMEPQRGFFDARVKVASPEDTEKMRALKQAPTMKPEMRKVMLDGATGTPRALLNAHPRMIERLEKKMETVSDTQRPKVEARLQKAEDILTARIEAALERFSGIVERLESRIDTLKTNGVDTSEAEKHLAEAKSAIDTASAGLSGDARSAIQEMKSNLFTIRQHLSETIASLKAGVNTSAEPTL